MPYSRLFYHFVWATQDRDPFIQGALEKRLHGAIRAKADDLGALVHAVGGTEDHVHLVVSVPPAVSLAQFVGQVKGNSAHCANHELALPYHFAWQAEYGVVSFGGKQLDRVVRYVLNQRTHHREGTNIPFLERDSSERQATRLPAVKENEGEPH